ncbi:LCP family protein [bacterium]|nr:LCP family protein [bacterium]
MRTGYCGKNELTDDDNRMLDQLEEADGQPGTELAGHNGHADAQHAHGAASNGAPAPAKAEPAVEPLAEQQYVPYIPQSPKLSRNIVRGSRRKLKRKPLQMRSSLLYPAIFLAVVGAIFTWNWFTVPIENQVTGETHTRWEQGVKLARNIVSPKASLTESFNGKERINILMLGLDHTPTTKKDPGLIHRCDSILIASTDFDKKQIRLASLPRDGWVQHFQDGKSHGYDKLGHTYAFGQMQNAKAKQDLSEGGINRSTESIAKLLDIEFDHYVVIEFDGFVELIDALGGLEVDVEKDMKYTDRAADLHINLKKGLQHLNGEQVMQYSRFRHDAMADKGRMQRQQKVIKLVLKKMASPQMIPKLPQLTRLFSESVKTSLSVDQLLALAQHAEDYNLDEMESMSLQSYWAREPGHERNLPGVSAENQHLHTSDEYVAPSDVQKVHDFLVNMNAPPVAVAKLAEEQGFAPMTVKLDASKSTDRDGKVVGWEVDWNGDGNFEEQSEVPQLARDFPKPGDFTIHIRVVDDMGKYSQTRELKLKVLGAPEPATAESTEG